MNNYIGYDKNTQRITISSKTDCNWCCVVTKGNIHLDEYNGSLNSENEYKTILTPSLPPFEGEGVGTIVCYFDNGFCQIKKTISITMSAVILDCDKELIVFKGVNSYATINLLFTNKSKEYSKVIIIIGDKNKNFEDKVIDITEEIYKNGMTYSGCTEFDFIINPFDESFQGFFITLISKTDNDYPSTNNNIEPYIKFKYNEDNSLTKIVEIIQNVDDNDLDIFDISTNNVYVTNLQPKFKVNVINVINGATRPYKILGVEYDEEKNKISSAFTENDVIDKNASNFIGNYSSNEDSTSGCDKHYCIIQEGLIDINDIEKLNSAIDKKNAKILHVEYEYIVDPTDEMYITSISGEMWSDLTASTNSISGNHTSLKYEFCSNDTKTDCYVTTCFNLYFTKQGCSGITDSVSEDNSGVTINPNLKYVERSCNVLYNSTIKLGVKSETSKWNIVSTDEAISCVKLNTNNSDIDDDILEISLNQDFYNQPTSKKEDRFVKLQNKTGASIIIYIQIASGLTNEDGIDFGFYVNSALTSTYNIDMTSCTSEIDQVQVVSYNNNKEEIAFIEKEYNLSFSENDKELPQSTLVVPTLHYNSLNTISIESGYTYDVKFNESVGKYYITYGTLQDKKTNNDTIINQLKDTNIYYFDENNEYTTKIPTPTLDKEIAWYFSSRGNGIKFNVYRYNGTEWGLCNDEMPISSGGTKSNKISDYTNDDARRIYIGVNKDEFESTNSVREGDIFLESNRTVEKKYIESVILKQYGTLKDIILQISFKGKDGDNSTDNKQDVFFVSKTNSVSGTKVTLEMGSNNSSQVAYYGDYTLTNNNFTFEKNTPTIKFRKYIKDKCEILNGFVSSETTITSSKKNVNFNVVNYYVNVTTDKFTDSVYHLDSYGRILYNNKLCKISNDIDINGYKLIYLPYNFEFNYDTTKSAWTETEYEKLQIDNIDDLSTIINGVTYKGYVDVQTSSSSFTLNLLTNIEDDELSSITLNDYAEEKYIIFDGKKIIFNKRTNSSSVTSSKSSSISSGNTYYVGKINNKEYSGKTAINIPNIKLKGVIQEEYKYIVIDYIEYPIINDIIIYNGKKYNVNSIYAENDIVVIDNYGYKIRTKNKEQYFILNNQKCKLTKGEKNKLSLNFNYYNYDSPSPLLNVTEIFNENYKYEVNLNNLFKEDNVIAKYKESDETIYDITNCYFISGSTTHPIVKSIDKTETNIKECVVGNNNNIQILYNVVVIDNDNNGKEILQAIFKDKDKIVNYNGNEYYVYDEKININGIYHNFYEKIVYNKSNSQIYEIHYIGKNDYTEKNEQKNVYGYIDNKGKINVITKHSDKITYTIYLPTFSGNTNIFSAQTINKIVLHGYDISGVTINNDKYYHSLGSINYIHNLTNTGNTTTITIENDKFEINIKKYQVINGNNVAVTSEDDDYLIINSGISQSIYDWSVNKPLRKIKLASSYSNQTFDMKILIDASIPFKVEENQYVKVDGEHYPIIYDYNIQKNLDSGRITQKKYNWENKQIEETKTIIEREVRGYEINGIDYPIENINGEDYIYYNGLTYLYSNNFYVVKNEPISSSKNDFNIVKNIGKTNNYYTIHEYNEGEELPNVVIKYNILYNTKINQYYTVINENKYFYIPYYWDKEDSEVDIALIKMNSSSGQKLPDSVHENHLVNFEIDDELSNQDKVNKFNKYFEELVAKSTILTNESEILSSITSTTSSLFCLIPKIITTSTIVKGDSANKEVFKTYDNGIWYLEDGIFYKKIALNYQFNYFQLYSYIHYKNQGFMNNLFKNTEYSYKLIDYELPNNYALSIFNKNGIETIYNDNITQINKNLSNYFISYQGKTTTFKYIYSIDTNVRKYLGFDSGGGRPLNLPLYIHKEDLKRIYKKFNKIDNSTDGKEPTNTEIKLMVKNLFVYINRVKLIENGCKVKIIDVPTNGVTKDELIQLNHINHQTSETVDEYEITLYDFWEDGRSSYWENIFKYFKQDEEYKKNFYDYRYFIYFFYYNENYKRPDNQNEVMLPEYVTTYSKIYNVPLFHLTPFEVSTITKCKVEDENGVKYLSQTKEDEKITTYKEYIDTNNSKLLQSQEYKKNGIFDDDKNYYILRKNSEDEKDKDLINKDKKYAAVQDYDVTEYTESGTNYYKDINGNTYTASTNLSYIELPIEASQTYNVKYEEIYDSITPSQKVKITNNNNDLFTLHGKIGSEEIVIDEIRDCFIIESGKDKNKKGEIRLKNKN